MLISGELEGLQDEWASWRPLSKWVKNGTNHSKSCTKAISSKTCLFHADMKRTSTSPLSGLQERCPGLPCPGRLKLT